MGFCEFVRLISTGRWGRRLACPVPATDSHSKPFLRCRARQANRLPTWPAYPEVYFDVTRQVTRPSFSKYRSGVWFGLRPGLPRSGHPGIGDLGSTLNPGACLPTSSYWRSSTGTPAGLCSMAPTRPKVSTSKPGIRKGPGDSRLFRSPLRERAAIPHKAGPIPQQRVLLQDDTINSRELLVLLLMLTGTTESCIADSC